MTRVAIVGRGRLGSAVRAALAARGAEVLELSRSNGFDVSAPVSFKAYGPLDAVVEATDVFTTDPRKARDFFVASTEHIGAAARDAAVPLHLLVSIVRCSEPTLAGNGYYAGKAAQERAFAAGDGTGKAILRSTLWYEFARQNVERFRVGPIALVPSMTVRPVALDAVAELAAQRCVGETRFDVLDVCGPDVTTLWAMTKALPAVRGALIPLRVPGTAGRALRDGTLLPTDGTRVIGPAFDEWLTAAPR